MQQVQENENRGGVELRSADGSPVAAFEEFTIEVAARGEEAVVVKEARVVEEVIVRREAMDRVGTVRDTVRRTEVEVEQVPVGSLHDAEAAQSQLASTTPRTGRGTTT